jgi:glycosyltransferase involved in cell wall biosynthesis
MPEVLGDSVEYFDPEDIDSILKILIKVIEAKPKDLNKKINKLKNKFNWNKTAKNTLKVYRSVTKKP